MKINNNYVCFNKVDNHGHGPLARVSIPILDLLNQTREELVAALEHTETHERLVEMVVDDLVGQALGPVRDEAVRYEHALQVLAVVERYREHVNRVAGIAVVYLHWVF